MSDENVVPITTPGAGTLAWHLDAIRKIMAETNGAEFSNQLSDYLRASDYNEDFLEGLHFQIGACAAKWLGE